MLHEFSRLLFAVGAACWAGAGAAQSAGSRIDRVTLYSGAALVERVASVAAGARSVAFECLPDDLDEQSLGASGSDAVRVGEISVRTLPREQASACVSPLQERIRDLEARMANLDAEKVALDSTCK